ncbi:hypothetical protein [Actinospica robiniae]|uniref:hypothetical protein n=1 Tax=Actinospica robiniae TaxID=304901 RepID=UPI00041138EA|nr:hypothetical protein [Actinospica robiniae]
MAGPQDMPGADGLPPGLAVYMSGHFDRGRLAFQRTLASLAERGWLEITPGDAATSTARLLPAPGAQALPRSEALVLERVRACSRAMPTVPLSVITDFEAEDRQKWMRRFTDALAAEAVAAGLTHRRVHRALRYPLTLLATAVGAGLGALADGRSRAGGAEGTAVLAFAFGLVVASILTSARPTDYGKRIASWARTQERSQPSSIAPRPAASPAVLVEKDGRPLPANRAWSSFTGTWRVVWIGPLTRPARGRPAKLAVSFFGTAMISVPIALVGTAKYDDARGTAIAVAPAALFVLSTALFWLPAYVKRLPHPRRVVYRGQVVKKWTQSDDLDDDATLYCCSVDGGGEEAATYTVKRDAYKALGVGDVVEVRYSPRWQILRRIRRVA